MKEEIFKGDKKMPPKKPDFDCDCNKFAKQEIEVILPLEIKPKAEVGSIHTTCCGEPKVECISSEHCDSVKVIVKQKICVQIPIKYTADIERKETCCNCCGKLKTPQKEE